MVGVGFPEREKKSGITNSFYPHEHTQDVTRKIYKIINVVYTAV